MARILVVDDERLVRMLLEQMLRSSGHEVESFSNAPDALLRIAQGQPDLLITDIFMPEKSGLEMILELRKSNPSLRIIAISGDSPDNGGAYKECLEVANCLGSAKILVKPFNSFQVVQAVAKALAS